MDEKRLAHIEELVNEDGHLGMGYALELLAEVRRLRAELGHSAVPRCAHCGVERGLAHQRECPTASVLFDPPDK